MRWISRVGAVEPHVLMTAPLTSRISYELLATPGKLYRHIQVPVWNARVRSGDPLSRGARRQHGAHGRRVRGIRQLFGVNPLPYCFLSSVPILELFLFPNCPIVDTGPQPFNALAGPLAMMDGLHEMLNKMGANANDLRAE